MRLFSQTIVIGSLLAVALVVGCDSPSTTGGDGSTVRVKAAPNGKGGVPDPPQPKPPPPVKRPG
jgi:hypothetical protein